MPCYDYIDGTLRKVSKIYDQVDGTLKEVKKGYDYIDGALREYYSGSVPMYELSLGSRVLHNGEYYTVIAKDFGVTGDVVLWAETSSSGGDWGHARNNRVTNATPFGEGNTNYLAHVYFDALHYDNSIWGEPVTANGYGWVLQASSIDGYASFGIEGGIPNIDYLRSGSPALKQRGKEYHTGSAALNDEYYYIDVDGNLQTASVNSGDHRYLYYAYSVNGELQCYEQYEGTYTLEI